MGAGRLAVARTAGRRRDRPVIPNGRLAHRLADLERRWPVQAPAWCRCPFDYAAAVAELVDRVRRPCARCGRWPETTLGVDGEAVEDGRIDAWEEGG